MLTFNVTLPEKNLQNMIFTNSIASVQKINQYSL